MGRSDARRNAAEWSDAAAEGTLHMIHEGSRATGKSLKDYVIWLLSTPGEADAFAALVRGSQDTRRLVSTILSTHATRMASSHIKILVRGQLIS